jgi:hypothetical protein
MPVDPHELKEEADARAERMRSKTWAGGSQESWGLDAEQEEAPDGATTTTAKKKSSKQLRSSDETSLDAPGGQGEGADGMETHDSIRNHLAMLTRQVEDLTEAVARLERGPTGGRGELPGWLLEAAGNPRTYDGPDPGRVSVCTRVRPDLYARLQQVQARLKLRSLAGALELVLRVGLAAAERLPTHKR